jgi:hypothetical protein
VWVVYLLAADNCDRPLQSRLPGVNQTVIASQIRVSEPCSTRFASSRNTPAPRRLTLIILALAYYVWGWGHGGTRNSNTSRSILTRSVNPAAIAGVSGKRLGCLGAYTFGRERLMLSCQLFAPRRGVIIGAETPARRTPARRYTLLKGQRRESGSVANYRKQES